MSLAKQKYFSGKDGSALPLEKCLVCLC